MMKSTRATAIVNNIFLTFTVKVLYYLCVPKVEQLIVMIENYSILQVDVNREL